MENSIENVWKQGFLKGDALIAPKLNDLYNQKSKNLLDRFRRKFRVNLIAILIAMPVLLGLSLLLSAPWIGIGISLLLAIVLWVGQREAKALEKIDKGESSYQYLRAFDDWLKRSMDTFTRLYRYFYPLFFLAFAIGFWFSKWGEMVQEKVLEGSDTLMFWGVPVYWLAGVALVAVLIGLLSGRMYRFDIQLAYGREIQKLEDMIADMEELRA